MKYSVLLVVLLLVALTARAQRSPQVHDDGTVTFSFTAPQAEEVLLRGSFIPRKTFKTPAGVFGKDGSYKMQRQGDTWTYTTKPLTSEMYTYYFEVDEQPTLDPLNADTVRDVTTMLNYFFIPGIPGNLYMDQQVAHGRLQYVWYPSSFPGLPRRRMAIYTPPSYDPGRRYPVLYLLHGSGGDETAWPTYGRAAQIMDNMIAQKRCRPMIVVMPNGIADRAAAPGIDPYNHEPASAKNTESMMGKIERAFIPEVVGYVENHYKVDTTKAGRAIAGLSLGGLHTLYISANNPEKFDYVGLFSAQTTNAMTNDRIKTLQRVATNYGKVSSIISIIKGREEEGNATMKGIREGDLQIYADIDQKLKTQFSPAPRLYYIAVGRDDFVKKLNDDLREKLTLAHYPFVYHETDGGHTWENWRKYLVDFLPRLFK